MSPVEDGDNKGRVYLLDVLNITYFFIDTFWSPGPDLNRHARNERGILSSLDRDITLENTT